MRSTWSDCIVRSPNFAQLETPGLNLDDWRTSLIAFARRRPYFSPGVFAIDLPVGTFYSCQLLKDENGTKEVVGIGRSHHAVEAVAKAYAEVLERQVMEEVFSELFASTTAFRARIANGEFKLENLKSVELPPPGLRTSNGWAVHYSPISAIWNAVTEAVERSLLLSSFLSFGWGGFIRSESSFEYGSAEFISALSAVEGGGFRAGIVVSKLKNHPGSTFGYLCDRAKQIDGSQRWIQAFFEAYEPLKAFDRMKRSDVERISSNSTDIFERYQSHFVLEQTPDVGGSDASTRLVSLGDLEANVVIFDVRKRWGLEFPFYAAFAFGGDLLPLFFRELLGDAEKKYIAERMKIPMDQLAVPNAHPIL